MAPSARVWRTNAALADFLRAAARAARHCARL